MSRLAPLKRATLRVLSLLWKLLRTTLRVALILMLVVIPIPILFRPQIEKPAPENLPGQVTRKKK